MAQAITSTGATRRSAVWGKRETAGQSLISMMENRIPGRYQGEASGRGILTTQIIWEGY
jgi:hypothetical protein